MDLIHNNNNSRIFEQKELYIKAKRRLTLRDSSTIVIPTIESLIDSSCVFLNKLTLNVNKS